MTKVSFAAFVLGELTAVRIELSIMSYLMSETPGISEESKQRFIKFSDDNEARFRVLKEKFESMLDEQEKLQQS